MLVRSNGASKILEVRKKKTDLYQVTKGCETLSKVLTETLGHRSHQLGGTVTVRENLEETSKGLCKRLEVCVEVCLRARGVLSSRLVERE